MTDDLLEDRLRRLLTAQADTVQPRLTGPSLRGMSRSHPRPRKWRNLSVRATISSTLAGAAVVALFAAPAIIADEHRSPTPATPGGTVTAPVQPPTGPPISPMPTRPPISTRPTPVPTVHAPAVISPKRTSSSPRVSTATPFVSPSSPTMTEVPQPSTSH